MREKNETQLGERKLNQFHSKRFLTNTAYVDLCKPFHYDLTFYINVSHDHLHDSDIVERFSIRATIRGSVGSQWTLGLSVNAS